MESSRRGIIIFVRKTKVRRPNTPDYYPLNSVTQWWLKDALDITPIQGYLRDIVDVVPDHRNETNIAIK